MIPEAAIEAAARAVCIAHGEWSEREWDEGIARDRMKVKYRTQARAALEAAAPYMLNLAKLEAHDAIQEVQRLRAQLAEKESAR